MRFRALPEERERVRALLDGSVDLIADVGTDSAERLAASPRVRVLRVPGLRELFLAFDVRRERTPYVSAGANPFRDRRVRLAFLRAIDTGRMAREVLRGGGTEASQLAAPSVFGFDQGYQRPGYDLAEARRLMREAGWERGFEVTLDAPRNVYLEDARIAAFVAESLAGLRVRVTVNALDKPRLFEKLTRRDTSFYMLSWSCLSGDVQEVFDYLLHTPDPARGYGSDNAGAYGNPELDRLSETASGTMLSETRLELLQKAVAVAMDDVPWVPIYVQSYVYALREPFRWTPRQDKSIRVEEIALGP